MEWSIVPGSNGMKTWRMLRILGGGIALAPLLACGHGMEFLLAKMELRADQVRLEVTADCEGNLMLPDKAAAREAMSRLFVVGQQGTANEAVWTALAPLRFEERTTLDPTAPLPPDPTWTERGHQLITAVWEWNPPAGEVFQLAVPKGEPLDTLLWRAGEGEPEPVKWKMLIAGDRTEWIGPLKSDRGFSLSWMLAAGALVVILVWRIRNPTRQ